jgi:hypothetical protein
MKAALYVFMKAALVSHRIASQLYFIVLRAALSRGRGRF